MAYRNDENAVEARRIEIERELSDVRSRADRFAYLKWRAKELETELAAITQTKESLVQARRLPMLTTAKIASPCSANWDEMKGDDRVRFCGSCQKNVYNLSALNAADAEALIREKEGNLCARFYLRDDDTVLTTDCPVGVRRKWISRVAGAVVAFGGVAAAVLGYRLQPAPIPVVVADAQPLVAQPALVPQSVPNPGMLGAGDPGVIIPQPVAVQPRAKTKDGPPSTIRRHTMGMMIKSDSRSR
ncbi:MAG: hypothetical protein ABI183_19250 [Polyangiaceae bacterium]